MRRPFSYEVWEKLMFFTGVLSVSQRGLPWELEGLPWEGRRSALGREVLHADPPQKADPFRRQTPLDGSLPSDGRPTQKADPPSEGRGVLVLLKFEKKLFWVSDFVEFVLGKFSHFNIAITYSMAPETPNFCEFTWNLSKTSTLLTPLQKADGEYGQYAVGKYPTGMHSCLWIQLFFIVKMSVCISSPLGSSLWLECHAFSVILSCDRWKHQYLNSCNVPHWLSFPKFDSLRQRNIDFIDCSPFNLNEIDYSC